MGISKERGMMGKSISGSKNMCENPRQKSLASLENKIILVWIEGRCRNEPSGVGLEYQHSGSQGRFLSWKESRTIVRLCHFACDVEE